MLTNDSRVVTFMDVVTEGGVVFTRSILQLCGVSKDDEALYTCVASNDVNISQSSFFLIVIGELVGILCVISSLLDFLIFIYLR